MIIELQIEVERSLVENKQLAKVVLLYKPSGK
jgi:hypothetical protein